MSNLFLSARFCFFIIAGILAVVSFATSIKIILTNSGKCSYDTGSIVTIVMNEEAGMVTGCPGDKISVRLDDLREIKFYSFEIEGDIK